MDGTEKLPLLFIGKLAKPRAFKNVKCFPVNYTSNKKAWMTKAIFIKWITDLYAKFIRQKRKVLLVVDNCSAHDPKQGRINLDVGLWQLYIKGL